MSGAFGAGEGTADADLVRRASQGESVAFGWLYERHLAAVYRYLLLRTDDGELAGDLAQDTFEQALDALAELREPEAFRAWLLRIAHNRLVNHWARQGRRPDREPLAEDSAGSRAAEMPHHALEQRLGVEALRLHQLSEREQRLLALRFAGELSLREIAQQLGCSEAAARQLQYRALQRLRALAAPEGDPS